MLNARLYQKGFVPLHPPLSNNGYHIHIHPRALSFLNDAIQDNHASFNLIKKIVAMRSNPRPWDGGIKKGTADHRQIAIDGILVNNFIESGCVCIDGIRYNPNARKRHEPAGLHMIKRKGLEWEVSQFYVKDIKTTHVAINGQNNNRSVAVDVMSIQLTDAYIMKK